ncbi:hypothetical protein IGI04_006972 [Brassica rapa subsp. trilocularis]|uniref:Uncharacterized protein n=1 Tax=Brassica rapa subsp. trilocularis TaxID=1813537 RepID=A0ABQ7NIS0_BRACM|nr:hypothetical protein IGI04_006972 [Brassica rapa subsp. trilocularis]
MCLLPTMNNIKSAKTKSTIPAKHQLNNGEILHPARRFESLPVLAVVRFNTGTFFTPPRQEKFISCIWELQQRIVQSFRSPSVLKQHNKTSLASSTLGDRLHRHHPASMR